MHAPRHRGLFYQFASSSCVGWIRIVPPTAAAPDLLKRKLCLSYTELCTEKHGKVIRLPFGCNSRGAASEKTAGTL
jgi:hypothetical protein